MKALIIVTTEVYKEYLWCKFLRQPDKILLNVDVAKHTVKEAADFAEANVIKVELDSSSYALVMFHARDELETASFLVTLLNWARKNMSIETVYIAGRKGHVNRRYLLTNLPYISRKRTDLSEMKMWYADFLHDRQITADTRVFDALEQFAQTPNKVSFDAVCELIKKND